MMGFPIVAPAPLPIRMLYLDVPPLAGLLYIVCFLAVDQLAGNLARFAWMDPLKDPTPALWITFSLLAILRIIKHQHAMWTTHFVR